MGCSLPSAFLPPLLHCLGHSKMIPESLQLLSRAFPAIQQKESRRTNLSSKQTYSTLFTLPTTGTITTAHDKDKDLPTCYYAGVRMCGGCYQGENCNFLTFKTTLTELSLIIVLVVRSVSANIYQELRSSVDLTSCVLNLATRKIAEKKALISYQQCLFCSRVISFVKTEVFLLEEVSILNSKVNFPQAVVQNLATAASTSVSS
ncbi:hypothetical protein Anapl_07603 [Anas platyrhynchos]|uniref:Uncharacterized protein n=1 Tax=Anas platyrhynchos TaxID=8839 RepID=R0L411_ANAPL|nr:hypothetical protein Anapl_07603 [Anas platyrhynchos]